MLHLKASAGHAFRMPTLNDRFWQPGGNLDLRPERGTMLDAGFVWTPPRAQVELTGFVSAAKDQIVWQPTAAGYWTPQNVARTRSVGLEASAARTWRVGSALLDTGFNATLTDARDRSDPSASTFGAPLRYVPQWTTRGRAALILGISGRTMHLDLGARAVGRRPTTTDASQWLPSYVVLDAQIRYAHEWERLRATLGVVAENLTDHSYEIVQSYVMPPRHLRVHLTLQTR
jgi:outer membrane cobalamin receptor